MAFYYFDDTSTDNTGDWTKHNYGSNNYGYTHDTVNANGSKLMIISGQVYNWNYGNWDYSFIGFGDDKDTKINANNNSVSIRFWHKTRAVPDTNNYYIDLYIRSGGSTYTGSLKGIPTSYNRNNISIHLKHTVSSASFIVYDVSGSEIISDSLTDNITNVSSGCYLMWGGLDSTGLDFTYNSYGENRLDLENLSNNGGMELLVDCWSVEEYSPPLSPLPPNTLHFIQGDYGVKLFTVREENSNNVLYIK
jgi:hypothetical protein